MHGNTRFNQNFAVFLEGLHCRARWVVIIKGPDVNPFVPDRPYLSFGFVEDKVEDKKGPDTG